MTGMAPVDLSDPEAARAWVESAAAVHGRIDVLYNNASSPRFVPMPDLSVEDWQYSIRNELDLVFYVTKFAWPYLADAPGRDHQHGIDLGLCRHSGRRDGITLRREGGVLALTRVFAADGAKHGIRAVSISPGPIKTPGAIKEYFHIPGAEEAVISQLLTDRVGVAEDIAGLAAFIASDEAAFMTGVDVVMDGGLTAL